MMTVKEVAERLRISPALVYALVAGGKIRHERHGLGRGAIRVTEEALEEYRKGCAVGPPASDAPTARRTKPLRLKHLEA
jgi:excisionase family DNA binding protein